MIAALPLGVAAALLLIALFAGIGTTALGPGGVLTTVGLFTLTDLPAASVAGTAIAAQIATGLVATGACVRSGHLRQAPTRRTAAVFAAAAAVGTPVGVVLGTRVDQRGFGLALAAVTLAAALGLAHRLRVDAGGLRATAPPGPAAVGALGVTVAVVSGTVGVGGPLLAVPLLIALGAPMLPAVAAAQVQSVVIALIATGGYALGGDVDWALAVLIAVPQTAGVLLGWRIARAAPTRPLQYALVLALIAVAGYLAATA